MSLKRELSLWQLILAGVGVILGAGIYALLGTGTRVAGEGVWLSFGIGGIIAFLTGLSYAELSSRFPKAGAEYVYAQSVFPEWVARICGFALLIVGFTSATTVALGFGGYLSGLTSIPLVWGALGVILLSGMILLKGARLGTSLAGGISLIEILGLIVVIAIGIPTLSKGFVIPEIAQLPTVLYGTAIVFFAFLGFEELVRMSEETKDAKRKMPIALLGAIALSSVLYVLVSASAIGLVGAEELGKSSSPLATVVTPTFGETGFFLMSLVGLFSTFNTVLLIILAGSRLLYGMGTAKIVPSFLGKTSDNQPLYALGVTVLFSCALLMIPDISILAQMTDALLFSVFAVMNLVVLILHWKKTSFTGFRVPLDVRKLSVPALLGLVSSIGMLFFIHEEVLLYSAAFFTTIAIILHWFRGEKTQK